MTRFTFADLMNTDFFSMNQTLGAEEIVLCLFLTLFMGLFIYFVYKKTYSGVMYSPGFNAMLVIISLIVAVIMIGISANLAISLGMIGALSIVRFRNAIKDTTDLTFLFWSISIGIVNGVQLYSLSIIATIFIGIVVYLFSKKRELEQSYVLVVKYADMANAEFGEILSKNCIRHKLRNTQADEHGSEKIVELAIRQKHQDVLVARIRGLRGVKSVSLFSNSGQLGI